MPGRGQQKVIYDFARMVPPGEAWGALYLIKNSLLGKIHISSSNDVRWESIPGNPVLQEGEVHIYRVCISRNLHMLDQFSTTLTGEEKLRGNKYFQLKDRHRFVISRGVQRMVLSRYLNIPPGQLEFILGDNKKPYVLCKGALNVCFNISHSGDWIMLVIAEAAVGADVEYIDPVFPFEDVLHDNFSHEETGFIAEKDARERFFLLWTRKEAILKATGQGLGEHLNRTPSLDGKHVMQNGLIDLATDWQVTSLKVDSDYVGSIATDSGVSTLRFFDMIF